jgi:hypothetical protein
MAPLNGQLIPPRRKTRLPRDPLATWCTAALWAIAALIAAASIASFAQSYRGLWWWAREHGLGGFWAAAFPAQVDVFIAVGELALFVALARSWNRRSRVAAWVVTLAGLGVSVAGNVGHVASHDAASRVTAGVAPVAATVALAVGLGVLKRVVAGGRRVPAGADTATPPTDTGRDKTAMDRRPVSMDKRGAALGRAIAALRDNPAGTNAELARAARTSEKTVTRAKKETR